MFSEISLPNIFEASAMALAISYDLISQDLRMNSHLSLIPKTIVR